MNTYQKNEVVSFLKTREAFGGLSNMAAGYPISLYGVQCATSEHLYQAMKFTGHPEIQSEILRDPNPMTSKMRAKKLVYRQQSRPDWDAVKLAVMDYCLHAKLMCNAQRFGDLLLSTGDADIVEISSKRDTYWGCVADGQSLYGHNHLGVQLTNLRNELRAGRSVCTKLVPPDGVELVLMGQVIGTLGVDLWVESLFGGDVGVDQVCHSGRSRTACSGGF